MNISLNHLDQPENEIVDVLSVGNRVKKIRQTAGYSLEDLAVTCGLTSAEISRIEDGVEIDIQHLKRIAPALQTSVSSLIEGNA
jgi:transcriptional regulator with XRE-family HTH domain